MYRAPSQNTFASTETQRRVKPLRMIDEVCFEMVTIKQTRLNKSFFRLKGVSYDVVLNFDKKRAFFGDEPQNKESKPI